MARKTRQSYENERRSKPENSLGRFISAQNESYAGQTVYERALGEIRTGYKSSHWMWYIFPQLRGLGRSETAWYYGLTDIEEAKRYTRDAVLGARLYECFRALIELSSDDPVSIFGYVDAMKLRSCATLFACTDGKAADAASGVLKRYYGGAEDEATKKLIRCVDLRELAVWLRALADPEDPQAAADFREKYGAEPPKLEPTQANLYADEEHYIELARAWCVENHIACAIK